MSAPRATETMLEAARQYARRGFSLLPVGPDKKPLVEWAPYQTEPAHMDQVELWWGSEWPTAGIGLVTGAVSGFVVLDADGPDAEAALTELAGAIRTWRAKTARGQHVFFRHPGGGARIGNRAGLRPKLDVRGDGGYVVLPPSRHPTGVRYTWITGPDEAPLASLPPGLLAVLTTPPATNGAAGAHDGDGVVGEGRRNERLYRLGRSFVANRMSPSAIENALLEENRTHCQPPLPEAEVRQIASHVVKQPDRPDFERPTRDEDPRPEIDTGNLGLAEMAAAAWAAIEGANAPPRVFLYAGALAWLVAGDAGVPTVQVMTLDHVRHRLAEVATFIRWTAAGRRRAPEKKPAFPPVALAADLLAVPRGTIPLLARVVHAPVFSRDGRLLMSPGYDVVSGLYLAPPADLALPEVPPAPSAGDIVAARELLCRELLHDFPFVGDSDLAHAIAWLLTPLLRELVVGCVPLIVVSKPTPRTGAGLLAKIVSIVHTGSPIAAATSSQDEEEMRKRLTSFLISSPPMILLDNLRGRLDSPTLAAILTTPIWEDRVLGRSQIVRLAVRSTFVITGNNVTLSNEMAGRAVLIRLDPKVEDPSTRTGFRHPHLEAWATDNRRRLLGAGLVLGQAWIAAGRPMADVTFGGFAEWAAVLGGVLQVAGIPGFLGNRREYIEKADEEGAHVRGFLADWWDSHRDAPVLVKGLIELARGHPLPIASKTDQGTLVRLGQFIQSLEDRQYDLGGGLRVTVRRAGEFRRAVRWRLGV
jgi:hypothetical protein